MQLKMPMCRVHPFYTTTPPFCLHHRRLPRYSWTTHTLVWKGKAILPCLLPFHTRVWVVIVVNGERYVVTILSKSGQSSHYVGTQITNAILSLKIIRIRSFHNKDNKMAAYNTTDYQITLHKHIIEITCRFYVHINNHMISHTLLLLPASVTTGHWRWDKIIRTVLCSNHNTRSTYKLGSMQTFPTQSWTHSMLLTMPYMDELLTTVVMLWDQFYMNVCSTSTVCAADITISYSLIKLTF